MKLVPRFPAPKQRRPERLRFPLEWRFSRLGADRLPGRPSGALIPTNTEANIRKAATARKMPRIYESDLLHADKMRPADVDAADHVLNEMIDECQQSVQGIGRGATEQEARLTPGEPRRSSCTTIPA